MSGYILSILGIVICGIVIDIILPSGVINKYVKSIFSIFVVAVILSPLINFINSNKEINLNFEEYEVQENITNYIFSERIQAIESSIENDLSENGFKNIDIKITYSVEFNELIIISCEVFLENAEISPDKSHINKYEFISETVNKYSTLGNEEIKFHE